MNRTSGSDTIEERKETCRIKLKCKQRETVRSNYDSSYSESDSPVGTKTIRKKSSNGKLYKIEASESSSASSEESSSESSSVTVCSRKRQDYVPPIKFGDDDSYSLKSYLRTFERYFYRRFNGTQKECSQELGQFLIGATKEAFDALGGGQTKYRKLKPKLLQWYKVQRCNKIHRHKFEEIEMRPNEHLSLYCIRLERSAVKAYPNNEKRQSINLKRKIQRTAPSWFNELLDRKREIKKLMKIGKSVSWGDIVELAGEQDKKMRKSKFNQWQSEKILTSENRQCDNNCAAMTPAEFRDLQQMASAGVLQCSHCKKRGHDNEQCRRFLEQCLLCGSSDHWMRECYRYRPEFGRADLSNGGWNVNAPIFEPRMCR